MIEGWDDVDYIDQVWPDRNEPIETLGGDD